MLSVIRWLLGYIDVAAPAARGERLLNLLVKQRLVFWNAYSKDGRLTFSMPARSLKTLRALSERCGCSVTIEGTHGLRFWCRKIRKRSLFALGTFVCVTVLFVCSSFVFSIEVTGNEALTEEEILYSLSRHGFKRGVASGSIDLDMLCEEVKCDIPELLWIAVNIKGSKAEVEIRERIEKPEIVDKSTPCDLVAAKDGVIVKSEIASGKTMIEPGQAVVAGDLLVSGVIAPDEQIPDMLERFVCARGKVIAKTYYTIRSEAPTAVIRLEHTGRETVRCAVKFFGKTINLGFGSSISYDKYDKITNIKELNLAGRIYFPVALVSERYCEAVEIEEPLDYEQSLALARKNRDALFKAECPEAEILKAGESVELEGDVLVLATEYECLEDIAKQVEIVP